MSEKQLLTVEDFKGWQRVNAAALAQSEEYARATMVDALLRDVLLRMNWGLQAACDHAWSTRAKHAPHFHRQAAREALEAIGWQGANE
ncbi:hypothetical protein [Bradyrhizobium sp. AUGA SZCCT0160]|uniref:hypothetical protein n=1 Tax=Bradyrhizobium sp. AUGA SZCCT0160 TaxID=2807662 RepID=UPI001BA81310|nr:hypothetical protein [Bradyrhizobium sp. AUGA SZCCT0160]MBR1193974.1 hypothetical protein [Bradyrhizobium sp. AUGA SZCCT0160]